MNTAAEAIVLGGGDYPSHPLPLRLLAEAAYVACCDGAADEYIRRGGTPDAIMGDGDSLSAENRERYASRFHQEREQETNDQSKAVRFLQARGFERITLLGATGKREDHTLGNISLLMDYRAEGLDVRMVTDHGTFLPQAGDCRLRVGRGRQVSVFNFGAIGLRAEGLRYPLRDFDNWWQGTLNEAICDDIAIHAEGCYLLFLNHDKQPAP